MIIIDGNNFLHRILHIPEYYLRQYNNFHTGGIFGFVKSLKNTLELLPSNFRSPIISVWDGHKSKRRTSIYPQYKSNRIDPKVTSYFPDDFFNVFNHQKQIVKDVFLPSLGVLSITDVDREADDVIYTICSICKNTDTPLIVISEDRDMYQMIHKFRNVSVFHPVKQELISTYNFEEKTGLKLDYYLPYKALIGDMGDNIKGIPGVGESTAKNLLNSLPIYSDEALLDISKKSKSMRVSNIYKNWGIFSRNLELIDISREEIGNEEIENLRKILSSFTPKFYPDSFLKNCKDYGLSELEYLNDFWGKLYNNSEIIS